MDQTGWCNCWIQKDKQILPGSQEHKQSDSRLNMIGVLQDGHAMLHFFQLPSTAERRAETSSAQSGSSSRGRLRQLKMIQIVLKPTLNLGEAKW